MFATGDTIVAIATPTGHGGLGVVRLSGPKAVGITRQMLDGHPNLMPRRATLARVVGEPLEAATGGATAAEAMRRAVPLDEAIVTFFPRPASYTGDDVVEISAHGSPVVLRGIVKSALAGGARLAGRGEFTLRAFLNGRLDLVQAEAVGDLIAAVTPLQAHAAFDQLQGTLTQTIAGIDRDLFDLTARLEASIDFPDEGYRFVEAAACVAELSALAVRLRQLLAGARRGRIIREGRQVTILGGTNTGKSSLFNCLAGSERAIVTEIPGTTRDLLTDAVEIGGISVDLVDTAGVRESVDAIEREGVRRALRASEVADVVLLVLDGARPLDEGDRRLLDRTAGLERLVVVNKIDLPGTWRREDLGSGVDPLVRVSILTGEGLSELRDQLGAILADGEATREAPALTNVRHIALVEEAAAALDRALEAAAGAKGSGSEEFVLADLAGVRRALEEVTGARTTEALLDRIFGQFCIGK